MHVVQALVLLSELLALGEELVSEFVLAGLQHFLFVLAHVVLEEPQLPHGLVKSKHERVALLEHFRVHHSLDVVEDIRSLELQRINFEVLVLDHFHQLLDAGLQRFSSQLERLLAEEQHFLAEVVDAFVEVLECVDDAKS